MDQNSGSILARSVLKVKIFWIKLVRVIKGPKLGHKIRLVQFGLNGIGPSGSKFGSNKFRLVLRVNHFKFELVPQVMFILTEAGAYPQLPTQPIFFDYFLTNIAI